jgi:hypothetical protein
MNLRPTLMRFPMLFFVTMLFVVFFFNLAATAVEASPLVVQNNNDDGIGSLRQAILDANPEDVIEFAPALSGQTIVLQSQLEIPKSLTIRATIPITVSGNNSVRIFNVTAGTVVFDGLTIAYGNAGQFGEGGGIRINDENGSDITAVTIQNSTLLGNYAGNGGAIYANTQNNECAAPVRVFIYNSTLSGNTAHFTGGGLYNFKGVVELLHSTITANTANLGGGVLSMNDLGVCTRMGHTLIAGNSNGDVASLGTEPRFFSLGYNLIGTAEDFVDFNEEFNQVGDQTNIANPHIAPLAANGGTTPTHALLPTSPAFDAGASSCALPADQRGIARPQNNACDIGAYEFACVIVVSNTNDSGPGSLRQAIADSPCVNNQIEFAPELSGATIALNTELSIAKNVTITGNVPISISGQSNVRLFNITTSAVTLAHLTLTDGRADGGHGGALLITDETTAVTLTHTTLQNNTASSGGAIYNDQGQLTIQHSTLANNQASAQGGGITNFLGQMNVSHTAIISNSALWGGGVFNLTVGGNCPDSVGATWQNSTLSGNQATILGGGLYHAQGVLELTHSTITNNHAPADGGSGVWSANNNDTCARVGHTIVAGNQGEDLAAGNSLQRFFTLGYNLIGTAGANVDFNQEFTHDHDQVNQTTPHLAPLADNGGFAPTHALLSLSTAVEGGSPTCDPTSDQRGQPRPQGDNCDIGAYESPYCKIIVQNTNNSGPGSLRQAVQDANCGMGLIHFAEALAGQTIYLTGNYIEINKNIVIQGNVPITIHGSDEVRAFYVTGGNVTFDALTITKAYSVGNGGAILISRISHPFAVTIRNSTLHDNFASTGAGVFASSPMAGCWDTPSVVIENSTISNNRAFSRGGGIFNAVGLMEIRHSTITNNRNSDSRFWSGGVWSDSNGGCTRVGHSIIAGNQGADLAAAQWRQNRFATMGHNVVGTAGQYVDFNHEFNHATDQVNVTNPQLAPLAYNGGRHILTHALLPQSPALDAGSATCTPSYDQRGQSRPQNGQCDVGAYEGGVKQCGITASHQYSFPTQGGLAVEVIDATDLGCLYVDARPVNHPQATGTADGAHLRTGQYWQIAGLQGDGVTPAATYLLDLTFPYPASSATRACKWVAGVGFGWDCASDEMPTSYVPGVSVTRHMVSALSEWAVGESVGPTAVSLSTFSTNNTPALPIATVALLLLLLSMAVGWQVVKQRS